MRHLAANTEESKLEPIPPVIGQEAGYTLDRLPVHYRAMQRQTDQTTIQANTQNVDIAALFLAISQGSFLIHDYLLVFNLLSPHGLVVVKSVACSREVKMTSEKSECETC